MKRKFAIGAALVAVLAATAGTYAWASAGAAATQTINACLDRDGQLRLVAIADACKRNETPLSWNTVGPTGLTGLQGVAGRDGRDGQQGAAGPAGASAADPNAVTATMTITGNGFPTDAITVEGVSHEIVSPRDIATGQSSGKRQHKPITVVKEWGASTPLLMNALVNNQNLTSVLIGLLRNGQSVGTIKLTNAHVSGYVTHGLTESWSFTYQKIEWAAGTAVAQDDLLAP